VVWEWGWIRALVLGSMSFIRHMKRSTDPASPLSKGNWQLLQSIGPNASLADIGCLQPPSIDRAKTTQWTESPFRTFRAMFNVALDYNVVP